MDPQQTDWAAGLTTKPVGPPPSTAPDWAAGLSTKQLSNPATSALDTVAPPKVAPSVWLDSIKTAIKQAVPVAGPLLDHPEVAKAALDWAKAHPGAAGAMAGGALAAPLTGGASVPVAMGLAGIGAAGGAAAGHLVKDMAGTPDTSAVDVAKDIATQGILGAAGEGIGRGVAAIASKAAPTVSQWLYKLGLRPTAAMSRNFPTAVQTGIEQGVTPKTADIQEILSRTESDLTNAVKAHDASRTQVAGYLGAGTDDVPLGPAPTGEGPMVVSPSARVSQAGSPRSILTRTDDPQFLGQGTQPGPPAGFSGPGTIQMPRPQVPYDPSTGGAATSMVAPSEIAKQARAYVLNNADLTGMGGRAIQGPAKKQLDDLVSQYLTENTKPLTVEEALGQKRAEQSIASASYLTQARGGEINSIETLFHQGVANANRQAVLDRVPEAAHALATEQGLIGLKQMATAAADRPDPIGRYMKIASALGGIATGTEAGAGAGLATAAIIQASQSPTLTGAASIIMSRLGKAAPTYIPAIMKALGAAYGAQQVEPSSGPSLSIKSPDAPPFNPPRIK